MLVCQILFFFQDWQEVVKLYERDNLFLAEASQMLVRNANFEIPALKRQIAKCCQLQEVVLLTKKLVHLLFKFYLII